MDLGSNNVIINNVFYNVYGGISFHSLSSNGIASYNYINDSFGGIDSSGNNITIENNQINNVSAGIGIAGINNYVINNRVYNAIKGVYIINSNTVNNTFSDNILEDLELGISISLSSNNTFYNCTIINSTSYGIYLDRTQGCKFFNCSIINSDTTDIQFYKSNITLINTSFNKYKVKFNGNDSFMTVQWYLHVIVKDMLDNPILNATVEVYNVTDDLVADGMTNENGLLNWITITERIQNYSTNITHTPHNISASKNSYIEFANPEPVMDASKTVDITLLIPPPLHHINIVAEGLPLWSLNNTSIASIDPSTGEFTAIAYGNGFVNVTDSNLPEVFNLSYYTIEPRPLHHIDIKPEEPKRFYIGDESAYTAIGWNNENESYQNTSWIPHWSVNNPSIATIDPVTGEFSAIALGSGEINVTAIGNPEIYKTIQFTIEPWPLHHIEIIPSGHESYYLGDTQTYTTIGWNDANETQMNTSWIQVWAVENTSIASIDSASGEFTALAIGTSHVTVSASSLPLISNTSSFTVDSWPLHHIEIIPGNSGYYYIGDMNNYMVIGWNDDAETQENTTWIPVWSIENITLATINESGFFTAIALGNSVINVSSSSQPLIFSNITFTIHPWPLHHIQIFPGWSQTFTIGDIYDYTIIGWNDAQKTQINTTWTPVWSIEGDLEEFTWEGETARFEVIKSGEGTLICEDKATGINVSTNVIVKKEPQGADSTWVGILTAIILIVGILMMILILWKIKKDKNNSDNP
jgi:parallel beta-helix repeat protein